MINILDPQTVKAILTEVESVENTDRKRNEWIAYQCTQGKLKDYVLARLQFLYPKNYKKMRVSDISVSKKVVDKLAQAYCEAPIRSIKTDSEQVVEEFNQIYTDGHFNSVYQDYDEIFNLHRQGLFWVDYDYNEQEYSPMALRPFEYDLVRDQKTGEVLCVILNYPDLDVTRTGVLGSSNYAGVSTSDGVNQLITESQYDSGAKSKVFALWTDTNHVVVVLQKKELVTTGGTRAEYAVTFVDLENNPNNINPLGMLPFVYEQKGTSIDYPTFNPITEQTISYNVLNTDLLTSATMQGFGQAVLKYPDNAEVREIEVGYMSAVRLPQSSEPGAPPTSFEFQTPGADLAGQKETYISYLKQVLGEYGVTSSDVVTGDSEKFTSGLDRLLSQADVQKVIKKNQETYSDLEEDVFEIIKAWESILGNKSLQSVDTFNIHYPRPQVQATDTDTINNIKNLLDMGLITKKKALMKLNPNLTEDEAELELQEIVAEKTQLMGSLNDVQGDTGTPQDTTEADQSSADVSAQADEPIYN